jgi:hypothetical protein
MAAGGGCPGQPVNPNLPQPYYQATGYGPSLPPNGIPYETWPNTRPSGVIHLHHTLDTDRAGSGEVSKGVREQITWTLWELGFSPKGRAREYQKPYSEYFDSVSCPRGFRVPDFVKFTGDDSRTTYEHIGQYLAQVDEVGIHDVHQVRLFPLPLLGMAFNWFTSVAPNSVCTWAGLEEKFHEYFYNGEIKPKLSDLTSVRQRYTETVPEYIKRFSETRNKYYSLIIWEKDLADLAFAGLSSYLREKLVGARICRC